MAALSGFWAIPSFADVDDPSFLLILVAMPLGLAVSGVLGPPAGS